jgi:hypothetical protein
MGMFGFSRHAAIAMLRPGKAGHRRHHEARGKQGLDLHPVQPPLN